MFNKFLVAVCIIILPIAIIGSYRFAKMQTSQAKPAVYDTLLDTQLPITPADPLNPNSNAEVIIDAPTEAIVGQLVRFSLAKSSGTQFKWQTVPVSTNFEIYENGRKAVFSTDIPGIYTFIVAAGLNSTVDVKTIIVKVTLGNNVTPPTPPAPPTPPTPPVTPTSTINSKIKVWADAVITPTKKAEALKLAGSFDSVASMVTAGALSTPEEIIAKTAETNRAALGSQLANWVPFLTNLQVEMKTRATAGTLVTVEQHAALWQEISKALKEYASSN